MRSRSVYRTLAFVAIALVAILRLVYLARFCPLDLAPDEAHYWDWSRHLDWCYYSKGPLVALLIRGSTELFGAVSIALTGNEMLAVRIPAVVCGSLLVSSLYVLTVQTTGSDRTALLLTLTVLANPIVAAGSTLMTIDAPFMALWGWALVTGYEAVFRDRGWAWLATGVLIGFGILAKHAMVLWLPCLGLYLLLTPERRGLLLRPGFRRMTALAFLGVVPIVWWNAENDWPMFRHELGHADHGGFFPLGPVAYLGTQAALLLGFWFVLWLAAAIRYAPIRARVTEPLRYLWCMSVPVVVFFGAFAFKNGGGEPNWPMAAYLAGGVLVAAWVVELLDERRDSAAVSKPLPSPPGFGGEGSGVRGGQRTYENLQYSARDSDPPHPGPLPPQSRGERGMNSAAATSNQPLNPAARRGIRMRRCLVGGWLTFFLIGLGATALVHEPIWFQPMLEILAGPATEMRPAPLRRVDPTCRLRGWRYLAGEVDRIRAEIYAQEGIEPVLAATTWNIPGEIGFYGAGHPT
ncbi:MAG TPA: glycosyltransferase family 39 protein, partial [Gemmataceae bacterium]|nr:glycosyltransferase family 39 protein [Gemmataceae bacterium]